jgi:antirestriction protein ArdC
VALVVIMSMSKLQQAVTDRIISKIEEGGLSAWVKPWIDIANADRAMPYNFKTGDEYKGINIFVLLVGAMENGYSHNSWLTFDQAIAMGGSVRKGEKSQHCIRYGVYDKKSKDGNKEDTKQSAFIKPFYLFNIEQIDGIEVPAIIAKTPKSVSERIKDIEALVQTECDLTNLGFGIGGNRAYYHRGIDLIKMPEGEFVTDDDYAATLAHELTHATGHSKRTGRRAILEAKFKDDSKALYAFEELCAEMGAAMICAEYGIVGDHLQHESYIDSWFNALKRDPSMLLSAASHASKAHRYLMRKDNEVVVESPLDIAA